MLKHRRNGKHVSRMVPKPEIVEFNQENLYSFIQNPMRLVFRIPAQGDEYIHIDDVRHNLYTWAEIHGVPNYDMGWLMGIEIVEGGKAVLVTLQVEGEED